MDAGIPILVILFKAQHLNLTSTFCCSISLEQSFSPNWLFNLNMADSAMLRL